MGYRNLTHGARAAALFILLLGLIGCEQGASFSRRKLIEHQALLDFSGLEPAAKVDPLHVTMQAPEDWDPLPVHKNALYTHQQWRSPSRSTGVGVAYVRLPLPLGVRTLVWFAKQEYSKRNDDGRVLAEWTDAIGRQWFEAENNKYHVRGFIILDGLNAWFIYSGYKTTQALNGPELTLAAKCVETITPHIQKKQESTLAQAE